MSANLPSHYVSQFASNIMLLSQQKGSRLRPYVQVGNHYGKQAAAVDQIGLLEMQAVTGRFQSMERTDATVTRRWVQPQDFDLNQMIDEFDKLRLLIDPQSAEVQTAVYAAGRQMDRLILNALIGTAYIGEVGTATQAFTSSQDVTISFESAGSSAMSVAKLRQARKILMSNNVDLDDPMNKAVFVGNAKAMDSLLKEAQVVSTDFNSKPVLVDGKITHFMGFDFVQTELIQATSTTDYNWVFCKSGVHLGIWNDVVSDISQRKDIKGLPYQAYVKMTMGATRLEEAKVVRIQCLNT